MDNGSEALVSSYLRPLQRLRVTASRREASRGQRQAGKWEDPEGLEVQAKEWGAFSGLASQQESMVRCGGSHSKFLFFSVRSPVLPVTGEIRWGWEVEGGYAGGSLKCFRMRIKKSFCPKGR